MKKPHRTGKRCDACKWKKAYDRLYKIAVLDKIQPGGQAFNADPMALERIGRILAVREGCRIAE